MKKIIYISLVMFLGFLLATIAHALLESWYIDYSLSKGEVPKQIMFLRKACYLPFLVSVFLLHVGILGGYVVGKKWWKIVYIEKRHWRKKINKKHCSFSKIGVII